MSQHGTSPKKTASTATPAEHPDEGSSQSAALPKISRGGVSLVLEFRSLQQQLVEVREELEEAHHVTARLQVENDRLRKQIDGREDSHGPPNTREDDVARKATGERGVNGHRAGEEANKPEAAEGTTSRSRGHPKDRCPLHASQGDRASPHVHCGDCICLVCQVAPAQVRLRFASFVTTDFSTLWFNFVVPVLVGQVSQTSLSVRGARRVLL